MNLLAPFPRATGASGVPGEIRVVHPIEEHTHEEMKKLAF